MAVLIDAAEYFQALAWTLERAEKSIFILSWDIDSRISLIPGNSQPLSEFLISLLNRKPELHIYILTWDFMIFYANERERKSETRRRFSAHPRIHFAFDKTGPFLVSLHQKMVVVDDQIAFCGGLDITQQRWDTHRHRVRNALRKSPDGDSYGPFHDVQMMVEGPVARDIRELCNRRWKARTGETLRTNQNVHNPKLWPEAFKSLLSDHAVAISRTEPTYRQSEGVFECKNLSLDTIRNAKKYIFAENQYFTSIEVADALTQRLKEPNPPEVLILVREQSSKWLEKLGIPSIRSRLIRKLKEYDRQGRVKILCPTASQKYGQCINLHSKVFIVDDEVLRIGSSNLNARSEGMDMECDLALEGSTPEDKRAIQSIRNRLLAEHLGMSEVELFKELNLDKSLITTISRLLRKNDHTLIECPHHQNIFLEWFSLNVDLVDPPNPARFHHAIRLTLLQLVIVLALIPIIPNLDEWFSQSNIHWVANQVNQMPFSGIGMVLLFALLTAFAFPLIPLSILFSLVLSPVQTFTYVMIGALSSASGLYFFSKNRAQFHAGWFNRIRESESFYKLRKSVRRQGWWPILLVRLTPLAPNWIVNVCLGMLEIPYWQFILSTFIGLLPGLILISIFEDKIADQKSLLNQIVLLIAALAVLGWAVQKTIQKLEKKRDA